MNAKGSICLEVDRLFGGYDRVPVLHGISFTVQENETLGILGNNGMGKTTLLKTLMGLLPAHQGTVHFFGEDITSKLAYQRSRLGLGYVPQGRGIFPDLSVRDNLLFAYQDHGDDTESERLEWVLSDFPRLESLLTRAGGTLSGGEQQILAIARCMMSDPDTLLLDEPTEGIQPSIVSEIVEILSNFQSRRGMTILLIEQNLDVIAQLSDRTLIMEQGRVVEELSKAALADQAQIHQHLGFGHAAPAQKKSPQHSIKTKDSPSENLSTFSVNIMTLTRPSLAQMRRLAKKFGMNLSDPELEKYREIMEPYIQCYDRIDASPEHLPEVRYPRAPGYRPSAQENPLNAWYYKTDIKGADRGVLQGMRIALKDTVCLAGVPMMNGSSIMEGYIPEIDATIVTRMLDAGATIAGKAHCENFCLSAGSHTNSTGPVRNPWKDGYMAGGSSSGSAALVAAGEVDMAIAGDQGGSIRIPSANCGVYGMKPTHGLVPYTGVMPIERTIDTVGPVTNSVADNALLLEVIAGFDGLDPRQLSPQTHRYTDSLGQSCHSLKIGVLTQGFGRQESESDVDQKVRDAANQFSQLGAKVEEVSIEEHNFATDLWTPIAVEGLVELMMNGNSAGANCRGLFLSSMSDHMGSWRHRADELSHSLKVCMFLGEYFRDYYRGRFYGKAQNLMRTVTQRYLETLQQVDLLLMPTVPMKAQPIPPPNCSIELYIQRAFENIGNTAPFNATGFPAMNVPVGLSEGLPIGMMLVARHHDEMKIYQAAYAFEQSVDWKTL